MLNGISEVINQLWSFNKILFLGNKSYCRASTICEHIYRLSPVPSIFSSF